MKSGWKPERDWRPESGGARLRWNDVPTEARKSRIIPDCFHPIKIRALRHDDPVSGEGIGADWIR